MVLQKIKGKNNEEKLLSEESVSKSVVKKASINR
jgi:hypothetical protein